jgi:8-oxo-dGTP diphosphatase
MSVTPATLTPCRSIVDALLILIRGNDVLLAQRQGTGYADGDWNLPSGKLEDGWDRP